MREEMSAHVSILVAGKKYKIPVNPTVEQRFDRSHGAGSFRRVLQALAPINANHETIGQSCGLSRERIRQLYEEHITPYLSPRDCRRRRHPIIRKVVASPFFESLLAISQKALRRRLRVRWLDTQRASGQVYLRARSLMINSSMVAIRTVNTFHKYPTPFPYRYGQAYLTLSTVRSHDFIIFLVKDPDLPDEEQRRIFIVPCKLLKKLNFRQRSNRLFSAFVNIPLHTKRHQQPRSPVRWGTFENAWRLLKKGSPTA